MIVTVDAELQRWPRAGVPPRSDHPKGRLVDSRQRLDATNDFLVKIDHLRRCSPVEDGGHVDGEDVARIHPGFGLCNASSVVTSMLAPASRMNEAPTCVTTKTRCRLLLPVIRALPLEKCSASEVASGSRGTKAKITAATAARTTPTQSRLESTVRSRARTEKRDA